MAVQARVAYIRQQYWCFDDKGGKKKIGGPKVVPNITDITRCNNVNDIPLLVRIARQLFFY